TKTKRDPDHPKRTSAFFSWDHIRDVSHRCWNARGSNAGDDASEKKPAHRRRQSHNDVIETESQVRQENHRPTPEAVGQNAEHGRAEKLHRREHRAEDSIPIGRDLHIAAEKIEDQFGQYRSDQTDRQHVERHGHKNKSDGGFARFHEKIDPPEADKIDIELAGAQLISSVIY